MDLDIQVRLRLLKANYTSQNTGWKIILFSIIHAKSLWWELIEKLEQDIALYEQNAAKQR